MAFVLLAATLWGISSAYIADLGTPVGSAAPVWAAGGALFLTANGLAKGTLKDLRKAREALRGLLLLGVLEGLNMGLFAAALQLGSIPTVMGLHLAAPVLILGYDLLRQRRRPEPRLLLVGALVVGALAILASEPPGRHSPHPALGAGLAFASAVVLAVLTSGVVRTAASVPAHVAAPIQLSIAALLTSPLLALTPLPSTSTYLQVSLVGLLLMGPALLAYWYGAARGSNFQVSMIGLSEAVVTTVVAAILFDRTPSATGLVSGSLILAAVLLTTVFRLPKGNVAPRTRTRPSDLDTCRPRRPRRPS